MSGRLLSTGTQINDLVLFKFRPFVASWFSATLIFVLGVVLTLGLDTEVAGVIYLHYLTNFPSWVIGYILITLGGIRIVTLILYSWSKEYRLLSRACLLACICSAFFWGQTFAGDIIFHEEGFLETIIHLWIFMLALWNVTTAIVDL